MWRVAHRSQYLGDEVQQLFQRMKMPRLPGHHVLYAALQVPLMQGGVFMKLDDKRALRRKW